MGARVSRTRQYVVTVGSENPRAVTLSFDDTTQTWYAETAGKKVQVRLAEVSPDGAVRVELDNEVINLRMVTNAEGETMLSPLRSDGGVGVPVRVRSDGDLLLGAASGPSAPPQADPQVKAPITGVVLKVMVSEGDPVSAGDPLLVLEAMKMESSLTSPCEGVVKRVSVAEGAQVRTGEVLIEVLPTTNHAAASEPA